jgi:hypothetical protein
MGRQRLREHTRVPTVRWRTLLIEAETVDKVTATDATTAGTHRKGSGHGSARAGGTGAPAHLSGVCSECWHPHDQLKKSLIQDAVSSEMKDDLGHLRSASRTLEMDKSWHVVNVLQRAC